MTEESYTPIEEMSFKEALAELDDIVAKLEGNELPLEDSLKAYERGVALLGATRGRLDEAQQKVTTLLGELSAKQEDIRATDTEE